MQIKHAGMIRQRMSGHFEDISLQTRPQSPDEPPVQEVSTDPPPELSIATLPHRRRILLWSCVSIWIAFALALGLSIYICYPKEVDIRLEDNTKIDHVQVESSQLNMQVNRSITVINPNVIPLHIVSVNATIFRNEFVLGVANLTDITLLAKSNNSLPITLFASLPYKIMPEIMQKCGVLPGYTPQQIYATYHVSMYLTSLGIPIRRSPVTGTVPLPCPPSLQQTIRDTAPKLPAPLNRLINDIL